MNNIFSKIIEKITSINKFTVIVVVVIIALVVVLFLNRGDEEFSEKYAGFDLSGASTGRTNTYSRYMERYVNIPQGTRDVAIDILSFTSSDGVSVLENFEGESRVLKTEESGFVEYRVTLEQAGLYNMFIEYFPLQSRGIDIERSLFINGETPFLGADRLTFQRVWGDAANSRFDNQGNEVRSAQIEKPHWESAWFGDSLGYISEPYSFYLQEGVNVIRLEGINEPMAFRSLSIKAPQEMKSYRDYSASVDAARFKNTRSNYILKVQGERAVRRSDPSLYPIYDRSSGATEPASVAKIRLNMIGGEIWRVAGQWIEWEFNVPENGMYRFSVKGRQNYNRGYVSNRAVMIDGQIPCQELAAVPFKYSNKWQMVTLQNDQGDDMYFPLERGNHTFRLMANLGSLGEMLNVMEESVFRLNGIYRKILVLTGTEPDIYRDYRVDVVYPEVITAMELESKILYKLVDDLTAYSGERSAQAAATLTLARQLELFVKRPDKIPRTLQNFKSNISSLGDNLLALSQSRLDVDFIIISAEDAKLPQIKENFFVALSHEVRSFFSSFVVDYNDIGDKYGKNNPNAIDVWILAGRDQSTILKSMIDDTFTPQTGVMVNVKLVAIDAMMPAVVAGTGPDMALTVPQGDVINYAIRKAVVDISKLPGYEDVIKELNSSVLVPFEYAGSVWGLPETQYYHVMFYRKDIFEELKIDLPDTWDDLISILPIIQKNNLQVGIPSVAQPLLPDFSNFMAHLFQRGGRLYNEEGSRTMLDSEIAIEAFDVYTKFYTHYKSPVVYDFVNRFRTGEMPLAFADYTNFNTLQVFAPELRGLWSFARMPGLPKSDGTIDRSVSTGTLASMIFTNSKKQDKAWEFLKWWVSADTQLRFGRELESIMGAAARYPTANYEAFKRLSWGSEQMAVLDEQRSWTVGTPEVPGGYFITRHIPNAVRKILNEGEDTRETLLDYTITINDELIKKRKEFGLE